MQRYKLIFVTISAVLLGTAIARAEISVGDLFPSLTHDGAAGSKFPATAGKVVLVDFWASWCAPCKMSFPAFARLSSELAAKGLIILAVSVDHDQDADASFVRSFNPPFFVAWDRDQQFVRSIQIPTMPTSFLVDRTGKVRFIHPGFHGRVTERLLRSEIAMLLAEQSP